MDDYNPGEHRPAEKVTLSVFQVFLHMMRAALGNGVMFMPYAFKKTGYVAAIICSIVVGSVVTHTAFLVVTCSQIHCKRLRVPTLDFACTAEESFKNGPILFQKYSKTIKFSVNILVCFVQFQTLVIYTIFIASSYQQIIEHFTEWDYDVRLYVFIFFPFFIVLSMVPNFTYLVPITIIGGVFFFVSLFIIFYYFLEDLPSFSRMQKFTEWESLSVYCTVFMYAVNNFSILMPLENSMREPQKMTYVLVLAMFITMSIIVIFGFFGYNKYIDADDTVIKNLPLDETLSQIVKISVTTSVLLTYSLHVYIPVTILWPIIAKKVGDEKSKEVCFRLTEVVIYTSVAAALPKIGPLLSLFGSIGLSSVMMLIPVLIEIATKWEGSGGEKRCFLTVKNSCIVILWAMILIFGFLEGLRNLMGITR